MRKAVGRAFEERTAARDVAVLVLLRQRPHGVPRTHVGPAGFKRNHDAGETRLARDALHDRVIDGIVGTGFERSNIQLREAILMATIAERGDARSVDGWLEVLDGGKPDGRPAYEDAAVPPVFARFQILLGQFPARLFDKAFEHVRARSGFIDAVRTPDEFAGLDVPVPRFDPVRHDTERDER